MHNVAFLYRQVAGRSIRQAADAPLLPAARLRRLRRAESGLQPTQPGEARRMASGIQGLRRLEVRDEHGLPCGLLIGFTEGHQLVVGIASGRGPTPMAIVRDDQTDEVFKLLRGALRGELP